MFGSPRPVVPGAIYHVMNRGNRKEVIFGDKRDRYRFRDGVIDALEVCGVKALADCYMDTHFHIDIVTPRANVSEFMAQLEAPFAKYSNARHKRVGHVFQGKFRHRFIESDMHLFASLSYIYMNPVKARLVDAPERYRSSSYAATIGLVRPPSYLTLDWVEWLFPSESLQASQCRLREVMRDPQPLAAFLMETAEDLYPEGRRRPVTSYVWRQRQEGAAFFENRPTLEELIRRGIGDRAQFIHDARVVHGYRLAEIARHLHLHRANVGDVFRRFRRALKKQK